MSLPEVVSRDEWLAARKALLAKEKELTRQRDALNAERRRLPMVEIDKDYVFEGPEGEVSLLDLFEGRRQLIVGHFMFDPSWEDGCPSCSAGADEMSPGLLEHLARARHVVRLRLARAAREDRGLQGGARAGRSRWYSSYGSDFNYDFHVTLDESVAPVEYNYRSKAEYEARGQGDAFAKERPADRDAGHELLPARSATASSTPTRNFARGAEMTGGSYYFLDLTALGRQEDWEEPKGRAESVRGARPDFAA